MNRNLILVLVACLILAPQCKKKNEEPMQGVIDFQTGRSAAVREGSRPAEKEETITGMTETDEKKGGPGVSSSKNKMTDAVRSVKPVEGKKKTGEKNTDAAQDKKGGQDMTPSKNKKGVKTARVKPDETKKTAADKDFAASNEKKGGSEKLSERKNSSDKTMKRKPYEIKKIDADTDSASVNEKKDGPTMKEKNIPADISRANENKPGGLLPKPRVGVPDEK